MLIKLEQLKIATQGYKWRKAQYYRALPIIYRVLRLAQWPK